MSQSGGDGMSKDCGVSDNAGSETATYKQEVDDSKKEGYIQSQTLLLNEGHSEVDADRLSCLELHSKKVVNS